MFSTKKRPPVAVKQTTVVTTTTTTRPGQSVPTTVTRKIIQVRNTPAPAPAPRPRPQPPVVKKAALASPKKELKRKLDASPQKKAPPAKSSKSEGKKVAAPPRKKVESSSEEEESESEEEEEAAEESDSSEDGLPLFSKRETSPCVERDVAAVLDGKVECISGYSLVMDCRDAYEDRE